MKNIEKFAFSKLIFERVNIAAILHKTFTKTAICDDILNLKSLSDGFTGERAAPEW